MLARALSLGTTVGFIGAGCSKAALPDFPTWLELTRDAVNATAQRLDQLAQHRDERRTELLEDLGSFQIELQDAQRAESTEPRRLPGDRLRFFLGYCKRVSEWIDRHSLDKGPNLTAFLTNRFDKQPVHDVHKQLLALPIHRFITSNYDLMLEHSIADKLALTLHDVLEAKAFTQDSGSQFHKGETFGEQLAAFAIGGTEKSRNMVFHCHGWFQEPKSMVVTEEDYQRWYLADSGHTMSFRQTLDILFGSHPILFVGFSLSDPDLLMALRSISATESRRKAQRPLFALFRAKDTQRGDVEQIYDQYGVHVVITEEEDLSKALQALGARRKEERRGWFLKPSIRTLRKVKASNAYWHYEFVKERKLNRKSSPKIRRVESMRTLDEGKVGTRPTKLTLEKFSAHVAKTKRRVVVIAGPGGAGKSWFASQVMRLLQEGNKSFEKAFFWSSYYADDALTGMDRAISFLTDGKSAPHSLTRLERFGKCLKGKNLLVFDGIERFLRPQKSDPAYGDAANIGVKQFLKQIARLTTGDSRLRSTVVLTSRLVPHELKDSADVYELVPMTAAEGHSHRDLKKFKGSTEALVSLLEGHRYGLELAARWDKSPIEKLVQGLADVGPLRRIPQMIELTVADLDEPQGAPEPMRGFHRMVMHRLAVFMGPITWETFKHCYQLANEELNNLAENQPKLSVQIPDARTLLNNLIRRRLLFEVSSTEDAVSEQSSREADSAHEASNGQATAKSKYVIHPVVREFAFHRIHHADAHNLPSFTLSGYTSHTALVDPGEAGSKVVFALFNDLRRSCQEAEKTEIAQVFCQEAFGVLRSRTVASTVPRWGSYEEYIHNLVCMADLAKSYCARLPAANRAEPTAQFWSHCDTDERGATSPRVQREDAPLFGDELAWLYNELGLACFEEGSMLECLSIWGQAYEINRFIDNKETGGPYLFQSSCNLGAANIQYGRLRVAESYLLQAKDITRRLGDPDHEPRIDGYLALVHHLRGDLARANTEYESAIDRLKEIGNARAEGIFLCHHADLKMALRDYVSAERMIRSGRAKFDDAHFPDLVAYARMSEGHLHTRLRRYQEAIREYMAALDVAKKAGIRHLEAEVHSELARLAVQLGDTQVARARAVKSLQISTELHLGLRQTHGLTVLGIATVDAGQRDLGIAYLKLAKDLAHQQQYWLRSREIEERLHRLGVSDSTGASV